MRNPYLIAGMTAVAALVLAVPLPSQSQMSTDARVDSLFESFTEPGSPGAAVAVVRGGEVVLAKGYGLANLELDVPITPRSVFYIGSDSKQFVATAIALLVQDGALSLNDDVRKYIPEIPDYGQTVTIRHLLHHTSGIRDYLTLMGLAGISLDAFHDNQPVIDLIARQRALNFAPGNQYLYSNSGYLLLAEIVGRVSGESIRAFAERRIFAPLRMHDTHFHDDYTHLIPRRASAYFPARAGGYTAFLTTFDRVGSGGVFSTVEDLARWDANFYTHQVGGEAVHEMLHTRGVLAGGDTIAYALGLEIGEYNGYRLVEHGGSLGGYRANILRLPDARFSVIILANVPTVNVASLSRSIVDLYLPPAVVAAAEGQATPELGAEVMEVPREELERVTGHYWNEVDGLARQIVLDGGKLLYRRGPGNQTELAAIRGGRFLMVDVGVRVVVSFDPRDRRPERMVVDQEGLPNSVFEAYTPWEPAATELEAFAGSYYSDELRATYRVSTARGGLVIATPTDSARFLPVLRNTFQAPSGQIVEFSTERGAVTGLVLQAGRVRNLLFRREETRSP
jgi:CubicO group peptidase (beta-lactamase class C family)